MIRFFLNTLQRTGTFVLISRLLSIGFIFLLDGFFLLYLSSILGGLLSLALMASLCLLGALLVGSSYRRHSRIATVQITSGVYPKLQFSHLTGLFFSLVFTVIPGLFSTLVGLLLYIPPFRLLFGTFVQKHFNQWYQELYGYARISEA